MTLSKRIFLAFISMAVLIGGFGAAVFYQEWSKVDTIAEQEAKEIGAVFDLQVYHLAKNVSGRAWNPHFQQDLENAVLRFYTLYHRDLFVLDQNKKILADREPEKIGGAFHYDTGGEINKTLDDGVARSFIGVSNEQPWGAHTLVTRVKMPNGESLAVLLNYEDVWQQLLLTTQQEMRQLAILTTGCILLAFMTGYAVQREVVAPLLRLQQSMATFTQGGARQGLPSTSVPELHQLFITFTTMATRLADSHEQLVQQQEHLAITNTHLQEEIEQRERVVAELREVERRQTLMLQSLPMAFYVAEACRDSAITWASEQVREVTGFSRQQFVDNPQLWGAGLHPDDRDRVLQERETALHTGQFVSEYRWQHQNGSYHWFYDNSVIVRDEGGTTKQLVGVWLDISERKRQEEQIRSLHRQLELILSSVKEGIYGMDNNGITTFINPAGAQLLGWPAEALLGKSQHVLSHYAQLDGTPYPREQCPIYKAFRDGQVHSVDTEVFWRRDGTCFPVEYVSTPIQDENGVRIGAVVTFHDISERKRLAEQQQRLFKEIEEANHELNDFAHVVSHDLKAPLRAIGSLASWIADDYADKLGDAGKEQLHLLLNRTKRMHDLIEGILRYSRIGRTQEQRVPVALDTLVAGVIDVLALPAHITIQTITPLPTVVGEPTRLRQVFQNLLDNAVKFMNKPQGRITIGCTEGDEVWQVEVVDNGPGIEERYFGKIFQIFQTLASRDECENTGIGLTIAKKIVELHGGTIQVRSTVGIGTTFSFTLPKVILRRVAVSADPLREEA